MGAGRRPRRAGAGALASGTIDFVVSPTFRQVI
jgi:hypothetical protein